ncbi:MAG: hypothetical protein WD649_05415 [Thermoleophilaceae bacterium]
MAVLMVTLLLATAAMLSARSATDTSNRDVRVKRAIAAAEAGLDGAVAHANNVSLDLTNPLNLNQQCLVKVSLGGLNLGGGPSSGWCAPVTENLGNGVSYEYRMSSVATIGPGLPLILIGNWNGVLQRKVVGIGKVDCPGSKCVERRVYQEATANVSASGISLLGLNLLSNLQLQLYRKQPGTFRECSSKASGGAPDSGC